MKVSDGWISIQDRLPAIHQVVLLWSVNGYAVMGHLALGFPNYWDTDIVSPLELEWASHWALIEPPRETDGE